MAAQHEGWALGFWSPRSSPTEDDMQNKTVVALGAAATVAVVIGFLAVIVAIGAGANRTVTPVAQTSQSVAPSATRTIKPRPVVTVTKHETVPRIVHLPPRYVSADGEFLAAIAQDGISAPDDWAIDAGRTTCGTSYDYAYRYLTDGGIYSYHVQTFLDDWTSAHGGC
jgi:ABC-type Fe3+-hydroxamate transport system substrate-binding protein